MIPDGLAILDASGDKKSDAEWGMVEARGDWPGCFNGCAGSSIYPEYKSTSPKSELGRCSAQLSVIADALGVLEGGMRVGDRGGRIALVEG